MTDENTQPTTAETLGQLRKELLSQGFSDSEAFEVVHDFVRAQCDDGFSIHHPGKSIGVAA